VFPRLQSEATGGDLAGLEDMGPLEAGPNRSSSDLWPFMVDDRVASASKSDDAAAAEEMTLFVDESLARFTSASNVDSNVDIGSCDVLLRRLSESFRERNDAVDVKAEGGGGEGAEGSRRVKVEAAKLPQI
jgi:hypothetical protein